jgi:uncharacterized membrane protein YozB (DUF420 family)
MEPYWVRNLPAVNAGLNGLSAAFLLAGYAAIRAGHRRGHAALMVAALTSSSAFLACYLVYHYFAHITRFQGPPAARGIYLSILLSHTVLAVVIVPMVLVTVVRAVRSRFEAHRRIARKTLPMWVYVSVTGVVIYWMLYHLYPSR